MVLTSAAGILSLLDEPMNELKSFALKKLIAPYNSSCTIASDVSVIDVFWAEISDFVEIIERLYEDSGFPDNKLAALVASKVHYHLGSYDDALFFALGAQELFDVNEKSEYVDTMIARCIDTYTSNRKAYEKEKRSAAEEGRDPKQPENEDPRMEIIVDKMFQRCFEDQEYKQALGIAVEASRMDIITAAINKSEDKASMLSYAFRVAMQLINNRHYREDLLRCLVDLYRDLDKPDFVQMCQCLIFLDDPAAVARVLENLSTGSESDALMAYQIAFDMYESATQQFLTKVVQAVKKTAPVPEAVDGCLNHESPTKADGGEEEAKEDRKKKKDDEDDKKDDGKMDVDSAQEIGEDKAKQKDEQDEDKADKDKKEKPPSHKALIAKMENLSLAEKETQRRIEKLSLILSGNKTIYLHLQFLMRNDHSDLLILKQTKDAVRVSICHTATVIANGFMHSGTTHDSFLRDNLEWLSRATNWAKLSATASLGVIHRGHETGSLALMQSYLPQDSANSSGFAEGGGLYALGLIHANHGGEITEYLLNQVKEGGNEQIRSGGCLGLGLAAMGTHRFDVYEQLKFNLYQDDAATGEAAGIAMGLVELGSKSVAAIQDMVAYAQETQHEKILRGLAVGLAFVMYGRLEEADGLIESLCNDKDAILRRSGMYTIAMAYCGTGSNKAIRRLLHVAVSDVNDDVRRAAVMSLGFLLLKTPEQCPGVVSLLSESYNPHVRYGAAMALGIACAGSGSKEAIALLEPMTNDPVNYVRQGALIASALILVQHTDVTCPKVKDFRALYAKVISDKHEDVMAKFGAILAQGIIDAGGRNATVSLVSRTGHTNMMAVVGMQVFLQYWYWFPLSHFLSLSFTPSCLIGLNANLDMPVVKFKSNAKASTYGYPPPLEEKKKEDKEKVATAVLSITAKQQQQKKRKQQQQKEKEGSKMEVDDSNTEKKATTSDKMDVDQEATSKDKDGKDKMDVEESAAEQGGVGEDRKKPDVVIVPEAPFELLSNPARVLKPQLRVVQLEDDTKYRPVKEVTIGGIIVMQNLTDEPCDIVEPVAIKKAAGADTEDEPDPPEPFLYTEDD